MDLGMEKVIWSHPSCSVVEAGLYGMRTLRVTRRRNNEVTIDDNRSDMDTLVVGFKGCL